MTYTSRILLASCFLGIFSVSYAYQNYPSRENIFSLSHYDVIKAVEVEGIADDLSGITYSPVSDSLFAVINSPPMLVELDKSGNVIRNIELIGFDDTEGVTYMHDNVFAITQERYRKVSLVTITSQTQELNASEYKSLSLAAERGDNSGLEGVAWSPLKGMFLANEKSPSRITRLPLPLFTGLQQAGKDYTDILPQQIDKLPLKDIAGLHVVDQQSRLLVLSDESRQVLELDFSGNIKSKLGLSYGPFGFFKSIEQPEGITMDNEQRIYIVGEPNNLLILDKKQSS